MEKTRVTKLEIINQLKLEVDWLYRTMNITRVPAQILEVGAHVQSSLEALQHAVDLEAEATDTDRAELRAEECFILEREVAV